MVAPGGTTNGGRTHSNKKGSGKTSVLRNMMCAVLDSEVQVSPPKKKQLLKQQWHKKFKATTAKEHEEFLQLAREAVLKQAEGLPGKPCTADSDILSPISLQAPVLSSIVDSVVNARNKDDLCLVTGSDQRNMATLKVSNKDRNLSGDSQSVTLNTNVEVPSGESLDSKSQSTRVVIREDAAPPAKDKSEQTIIKLLLSDVWSGNEQIVECSLKLINICLEKDPTSAQAMVPVGGHTVMLGIMKKWRNSAKIQAHCCHFLGKCSSVPNNTAFADAALKYGALHKIHKALIKFPKYLMVQTTACQALEQMLLVCIDHKAVVDGINVALVVSAMKTLALSAPLQKAGVGILQQLTTTSDPVLVRTIVTTGGLEVLGGAYHCFCDMTDDDHCAIRERCRATIPYLLTDPTARVKQSCMLFPSAAPNTPTDAGCMTSFFACRF